MSAPDCFSWDYAITSHEEAGIERAVVIGLSMISEQLAVLIQLVEQQA